MPRGLIGPQLLKSRAVYIFSRACVPEHSLFPEASKAHGRNSIQIQTEKANKGMEKQSRTLSSFYALTFLSI